MHIALSCLQGCQPPLLLIILSLSRGDPPPLSQRISDPNCHVMSCHFMSIFDIVKSGSSSRTYSIILIVLHCTVAKKKLLILPCINTAMWPFLISFKIFNHHQWWWFIHHSMSHWIKISSIAINTTTLGVVPKYLQSTFYTIHYISDVHFPLSLFHLPPCTILDLI